MLFTFLGSTGNRARCNATNNAITSSATINEPMPFHPA